MAGQLLETKLHAPRRRPGLVTRARLTDQLRRGTSRSALTVVSAPAGFGKTTMLQEWLAAAGSTDRSVGWLSIDQRDNDPAVFWTYLITALKSAVPGIGADALALLRSSESSIEVVLSTIVNDLDAVGHDVVLVLDDYHLIETPEVHQGMAFLLGHLPAQLHLVIAGRADPPLPLAGLRGRGDLTEIRGNDMRFTPTEAAAYLNGVVGLDLTARDVAALEGRTEGWIAALQLAALSMQGRDDVEAFIAGFAGDDRFIVDYLAEEVLNRQPEDVRQFLLQTSVLDRLSGPLCEAVTGQPGGRARLAALERGNLFVVPLDDRRQWYRYHQLFADVLQAHLLDEQPHGVAALHQRASQWHEQNGERSEAIRHALAAEDFGRTAALVEQAIPELRRNRQEAVLRRWIEALPAELVRMRPVLVVGYAGALAVSGDFDAAEAQLRDAERFLGEAGPGGPRTATASAGMVVVDLDAFGQIPGTIELYRAAQALARGDRVGTFTHARLAVDRSSPEDFLCRAAVAGLLGLAHWGDADLDAAHSSYAACMSGLYRAGHVADTFGCAIALADIRVTQGRLGDALRTYELALQHAAKPGGLTLRGTADMYVGMSEIRRERGDLPAATELLLRGQQLGEHIGLPQNPYRWRVAMARIRQAEGDLNGALELLDEAGRLYVGDLFPNVRPVPAFRARICVALGRLDDAQNWARQKGLAADDDLGYLREFEHITLARLLLARHAAERADHFLQQATGLLTRLRVAAEAGGRTGSLIEILLLQAICGHSAGDSEASLAALGPALTLAAAEGYVRIFADEGQTMAALLGFAAERGIAPDYARSLVAAMHPSARARPDQRELIEPLSARELDVLRLLATELDGPDIARKLFVSLNTVRTHTKSIYTKLAVNNRRAAVRRGRELDLLA